MFRLKTKRYLLLLPLLLAAGCKNPFDRTEDKSGGGALNAFGSGSFVVFSSELKTGGGAFLYPAGENQNLTFNDTSNPVSSRSIRYVWNGGDVAAQSVFAGFDLMHTPTLATYTSTVGRNLAAANYTKVKFFIRGTLSDDTLLKVEVADDGAGGATPPCIVFSTDGLTGDPGSPTCTLGTLGSSWLPVTNLGVTSPQISNIKDFFKATFVYLGAGQGNGGTVYFDNIEFSVL